MPPLIKPSRSKPSISVTQKKFPVAPETAWVTVSLISLTSLDTLMKYPFTSLKAVTSYPRRSGSGKASKWTFFPVSATLPKTPIQSKSEVLMNPYSGAVDSELEPSPSDISVSDISGSLTICSSSPV